MFTPSKFSPRVLHELVGDCSWIEVQDSIDRFARVLSLVIPADHDNTPATVGHRDEVLQQLAPLSLVCWIKALLEVDVLGLAFRLPGGSCWVA
jgi:hypothetical protein